MTFQTMTQSELASEGLAPSIPAALPTQIPDVLFEQLDYLIQFADQEHERLERVKAILMEPFH